MALNVDWPLAQSLFQEGVSLKAIAGRTGIPYQALHKHSKRHNWQVLALTGPAPPTADHRHSCPEPVKGQAARWQSRILDTASRHLDAILDKSSIGVDIDTLEKLVRVLNATDLTARRTLGLDSEHSSITLHVQSELTQPERRELPAQTDQVVDVETVPGGTQSDTAEPGPVKSAESPINPA